MLYFLNATFLKPASLLIKVNFITKKAIAKIFNLISFEKSKILINMERYLNYQSLVTMYL